MSKETTLEQPHVVLQPGSATPSPSVLSVLVEESLSPFDYAQMCLALVNVARRIHELKAAKNQPTTQQEEQA